MRWPGGNLFREPLLRIANLKRYAGWMGAVFTAAFCLVVLVVFLGGYNVAASSDHWGVTRWLLRSVRDASIALRRPEAVLPPLFDEQAIRLAAGHYADECETCHSAPGRPVSALGLSLTPAPPYYAGLAQDHTPEELFWIVKHGIKMTGMPAWPAQSRDDEVRAMVALLERLPAMSAGEYRRLAHGPRQPPTDDRQLMTCAHCHGLDGLGRHMKGLPVLAHQKPGYLSTALDAFRDGRRHSGFMQTVAANLTDEDISRLAGHYAAQPRPAPPPPAIDSEFRLGRMLATQGSADNRVPACTSCHGLKAERGNPFYPDIRGQPADYIRRQLALFRSGDRGGTAYRGLMRPVALALSDAEVAAVARYYASLSPAR